MWLLLPVALASGHYHPAEIAEHSEAFATATEVAATTFTERNRTGEQIATGLREYEAALDLLGDRAPVSERERQVSLEETFRAEKRALEGFANQLMLDYDTAFLAAMERALDEHPEAAECRSEIPMGPALPGIGGRTKPNPDCTGDDLNPAIAASMDEDEALTSTLDELNARVWPTWTLDPKPVDPIGTGPWVPVFGAFQTHAAKALRAIDQADEDGRIPILAAAEQGEDPEDLKKRARAVSADTASARAELGGPIFEAVDSLMAKRTKRDKETLSWCAAPVVFGGCTGPTATAEQVDGLFDDCKVARALP